MNKLGDRPAFPCDEDPRDYGFAAHGMTYRQWLVGMALQGLLANSVMVQAVAENKSAAEVPSFLAAVAVDMADCVIAQLEKHS